MRQYWNIAVGVLCAVLVIGAVITCSTIVLTESGDSEKEVTEAPKSKSLLGGISGGDGDDKLKELRRQLEDAHKKIEELEALVKKGPKA
jgi:hypothetical protein